MKIAWMFKWVLTDLWVVDLRLIFFGASHDSLDPCNDVPLRSPWISSGNFLHSYWKRPNYSWFTYKKLWFSIFMLDYQRIAFLSFYTTIFSGPGNEVSFASACDACARSSQWQQALISAAGRGVVAQSAAVSACEKMGKWWLGDLESREWRFGRDVIFWHRDLGKIHGMEMKWGWKSWRGNRGCETFYPSWSMSLGNTPTSYIEEYNVGPPR